VKRAVGYASGAILASLLYVIWLIVSIPPEPSDVHGSLAFRITFSFFFWLVDGFALTLLVMIIPWIIVVWSYRRMQWSGRIYFPIAGSLLLFVIGCAATSIAPTPLWMEYQTFLQGALIAAQRQGICFFASGLVFGASYWLLGERHIPLHKKHGFPESVVAPDSSE
jgi:hypothetical protein